DQGKPAAGKPIEIKPTSKGKAVPKDAGDFASALEQTAKAEAELWEKYGPMADKSHRMGDKVMALNETVDRDFASKEKKQEVRRELGAARVVLKDIGDHADQIVASALKFLRDTNEGLTAAANAEPKKNKKAKPARSGAPHREPSAPPPGKKAPPRAAGSETS